MKKRLKHPCTINGIDYESESAAARDLGIHSTLVHARLKSSNFPEYVSKYHRKETRRAFVPCSIAGVEYRAIGHATRSLKITYEEMLRRLASFDYPDYVCARYPKIPFKYEVRGKKYRTMREIAEDEGVSRERIRQKIRSPFHKEYKTLTSLDYPDYVREEPTKKSSPLSRQWKNSCVIAGIHYESETAAAKALKISSGTVANRLLSYDYPEYISEHRPKKYRNEDKAGVTCAVAGIEYKSVMSAKRALGISYGCMKHRLTSLDYPDYICEKYPKKIPKPSQPFKYEARGKKYKTLREIAVIEGITESQIWKRIYNSSYKEYKRI